MKLWSRFRSGRGASGAAGAGPRQGGTGRPPQEEFRAAVAAVARGDLESARLSLQVCMAARHPDWSPRAAGMLGEMLWEQADLDGARKALQIAVDYGGEWSLPAAVTLGAVLAARGDVEGARHQYQRVMAIGQPKDASMAAFNLGVLLAGQQDIEGARIAYQAAVDSGDADMAPRAAASLGALRGHGVGTDAAQAPARAAGMDDGPPMDAAARQRWRAELQKQIERLRAEQRQTSEPSATGDRELEVYSVLTEMADLAEDDDLIDVAIDGYREAYQYAEALAQHFAGSVRWSLAQMISAGRLGDLCRRLQAPDEALRWYRRGHRAAERLASLGDADPAASAEGALHAGRFYRLIEEIEGARGAG